MWTLSAFLLPYKSLKKLTKCAEYIAGRWSIDWLIGWKMKRFDEFRLHSAAVKHLNMKKSQIIDWLLIVEKSQKCIESALAKSWTYHWMNRSTPRCSNEVLCENKYFANFCELLKAEQTQTKSRFVSSFFHSIDWSINNQSQRWIRCSLLFRSLCSEQLIVVQSTLLCALSGALLCVKSASSENLHSDCRRCIPDLKALTDQRHWSHRQWIIFDGL